MDSKKIGKFILQLRNEKKMSQEELSKKLSVSRTTISKWERGNYIPSSDFLYPLSKIFDVSVNEILAGQKMNKDNKKDINNIAIKAFEDSEKKRKKLSICFMTVILVIIVVFLIYYFFNTYGSIKVYKITSEENNINIEEGIMIVSREKAYIKLGKIKDIKEDDINNIYLYYIKDGKQEKIISGTGYNNLLINIFGYDELFSYDDIPNLEKNLFLEISYNNKKETIKLNLQKDFSNKSLFKKKVDNISKDNSYFEEKTNMPSYINSNFKFDEQENKFFLKLKKGDTIVNQVYIVDSNLFIVDEETDLLLKHFEYSNSDRTLTFFESSKEKIKKEFTFNYLEKRCIEGDCDLDIIEHFKKEYLSS